jgi:hypothetical protein
MKYAMTAREALFSPDDEPYTGLGRNTYRSAHIKGRWIAVFRTGVGLTCAITHRVLLDLRLSYWFERAGYWTADCHT